jgi:hypothetical protein
MSQNGIFNERGEYVSSFCRPEQGPLRPSRMTSEERAQLLPGWAYGDHDELPYVTTADHRSVEGRIVPLGTPTLATRRAGVVTLRAVPSGQTIVLDGLKWCVPVEGAPRVRPEDAPELFLPA